MDKQAIFACDNLDTIYEAFEGLPNKNVLMSETQGWNIPALSPSHIAWLAKGLAESLRRLNLDEMDDDVSSIFVDVNKTIGQIVKDVLPNLPGNPPAAVQGAAISLMFINAELSPVLGWDSTDKNRLPGPLIRKIAQLQREVDGLIPDKNLLASQLKLISDATEAAEALPTTLQELKATQAEIRQTSTTSSELFGKIQELHKSATEYTNQSRTLADESRDLIAKAAEASG